jgi:hypothetical protein
MNVGRIQMLWFEVLLLGNRTFLRRGTQPRLRQVGGLGATVLTMNRIIEILRPAILIFLPRFELYSMN